MGSALHVLIKIFPATAKARSRLRVKGRLALPDCDIDRIDSRERFRTTLASPSPLPKAAYAPRLGDIFAPCRYHMCNP